MRTRGRVLVLLLASAAFAACARESSGSRRFFVAAGGAGDGRSWAEAAGSLAEVLASAPAGAEIWVASGTYRPAPPGGPRTATFELPARVTLRGGFAGDEAELGQRDPQNPPSILDGDLSGDDGPDFSGRTDNVYHVLTAHMVEGVTLENFRVRGGYADGPSLGAHVESGDQGSGLNVFHAEVHVVCCTFLENWAANHGTVNDHGGGRYEDCVFSANHAGLLGAGLYFHGDIESHALRCRFLGNQTPGQGGGAYTRSALPSTFEDCTFLGNRAERGAGIYLSVGNATDVLRCSFAGNQADIGGGGAYVDDGTSLVADCEFVANAAGHDVQGGGAGAGGSGGGGLWASLGAPRVEDCLFDSNSASFGAGIYVGDGSAASVRGCQFVGGSAFEAGGLYVISSPALAEDCLFLDNHAQGGAFSVGGGMSVYISPVTARRLRFVDNSAELGGGGLYTEGESPTFECCEFVGNRALGPAQGWGGGYMAGYFTEARLASCAFQGNRARQGGGMFAIAFAEPTLVNATFAGNFAEDEGGALEALILSGTRLQNSVSWGNLPQEFAGLAPLLERSCVLGGAVGDGNLASDPLFVRPPEAGPDLEWGTEDDLHGDLHLAAGSPCRDAGDDALLFPEEDVDLDGNPRVADDPAVPDTGAGGPPTVDLGAYEAGPGS